VWIVSNSQSISKNTLKYRRIVEVAMTHAQMPRGRCYCSPAHSYRTCVGRVRLHAEHTCRRSCWL